MPHEIIKADFTERDIQNIKQFAEAKGMTEAEFVEYATRKLVNDVKRHAQQAIKPNLTVIK